MVKKGTLKTKKQMKVTVDKVTLNEVPPAFGDVVTLRVKEASFGPNNAGNPQVSFKTEIIEPETFVSKAGVVYALDGVELSFYFPFKVNEAGIFSEAKTRTALGNFRSLLEKFGLDPDFDDENPDFKALEGICFRYPLRSREKILQRKTETGSYEPMMEDGKSVSGGWEFGMGNGRDILKKVEPKVGANKPY